MNIFQGVKIAVTIPWYGIFIIKIIPLLLRFSAVYYLLWYPSLNPPGWLGELI